MWEKLHGLEGGAEEERNVLDRIVQEVNEVRNLARRPLVDLRGVVATPEMILYEEHRQLNAMTWEPDLRPKWGRADFFTTGPNVERCLEETEGMSEQVAELPRAEGVGHWVFHMLQI